MVKTSFGPNGMNKMIINHLDKLFVTNDAATMIRELEVEHPAAKLLVMASEQQSHEVGDGTNFVIIFSGMLLQKAESLLHMVRCQRTHTSALWPRATDAACDPACGMPIHHVLRVPRLLLR